MSLTAISPCESGREVTALKPYCEVRRKLGETLSTAARVYSETVVKLATAGLSKDDYVRLRDLTEEAQNSSEAAFAAYQEHLDSHQCWDGSATDGNLGWLRQH